MSTSSNPNLSALSLPRPQPGVLGFLHRRRSNLAKLMQGGDPASAGPDAKTLDDILTIAARVPDHRKLAPWRFIIFAGDDRAAIGPALARAFKAQFPEADAERVQFEADRFLRASVVIAVISTPKDCPRGTPVWEQELSAGAVCFNMLLAAQAHGFAAQWLSEWYAYDPSVTAAMGLGDAERVAGFIYIGSVSEAPTERPRPDVGAITQYGLP